MRLQPLHMMHGRWHGPNVPGNKDASTSAWIHFLEQRVVDAASLVNRYHYHTPRLDNEPLPD